MLKLRNWFAAAFVLYAACAYAQVQPGTSLVPVINQACSVAPTACAALFGYANAAWYGVKCDGTTDDGPAFTTAFASTRPVKIPNIGINRCVVKTQVTYTSPATTFGQGPQLFGQGRDKTVIDNQTGSFAFLMQSPANNDYLSGTIFSDFEITSTTSTPGAGGIEVYRGAQTKFNNLHLTGLSGTGLYMPASAGDLDAAIQVNVDGVRCDAVGTGAGSWCMNFSAPSGGYFGSNLFILNSNASNSGQLGTAAVPPTTGGIYYKGLIATLINDAFTQNNGPDLYIGGPDTSQQITIIGTDFENNVSTVLPHIYADGALNSLHIVNSQCLNNDSFVSQGCLWLNSTAGVIANVTLDKVQVRASSGNNTYTAFKTTGSNAVLDTIRSGNIWWTSGGFDFSGQTRFSGFQFSPTPGQAQFSISALNTAQLIPIGVGAVMPMKLAATGEWIAYHVPVAGITRAGIGGLAATTTYYFYLYNSASVGSPFAGAIEVSATPPTLETTEGYYIKTGDSTRTYIGSALSDGSGNFQTTAVQISQYPPGGGFGINAGPIGALAYYSAAGLLSPTPVGVIGTVLVGQGAGAPLFTRSPQLGTIGSLAGQLCFANATSGTVCIQPATGALGSAIATLPAGTYNFVGDSLPQTLTNKTLNCANNTCTVQTTSLSGALQAAQEPAHTGDVTNTAGSLALSIAAGAVTNAKLANAATTVAGQTCTLGSTCGLSSLTNSLGADVAMNNTVNYFDGPSVAQGTTGTWFASGTVTVLDTTAAQINCKLWDGTTVMASARIFTGLANAAQIVALSGILATPAGNIRMSCNDVSTTAGLIKFNQSGNSKDSTISAFRIN
jgi:hypothetical protein